MHCANAVMRIECVPDNCGVQKRTGTSSGCLNRSLQSGRQMKVKVGQAGEKGLGLFADEDIGRGQMVAEYVGEIIEAPEREKRLSSASASDKFYILQLKGGRDAESIDATKFGNKARFINHSCRPNLVLQQWTVDGEERLSLWSRHKIKRGEELTVDYNFESPVGAPKTTCHCGFVASKRYIHILLHFGNFKVII